MKQLLLKNTVIACISFMLSGAAFSAPLGDRVYQRAQRDVIKSCSRYVAGTDNPAQSEKENVAIYLNYLGVILPETDALADIIMTDNKMLSAPDMQLFININNFNREQGVTLCALKSAESLNRIQNSTGNN